MNTPSDHSLSALPLAGLLVPTLYHLRPHACGAESLTNQITAPR